MQTNYQPREAFVFNVNKAVASTIFPTSEADVLRLKEYASDSLYCECMQMTDDGASALAVNTYARLECLRLGIFYPPQPRSYS